MRVLVAGRNAKVLAQAASAFSHDLTMQTATSKVAALELLDQGEFDLVLACERLNDGSGLEVLSHVAVTTPNTLRIFAARPGTLELLKGELGLFGLFRTLSYPIKFPKLWAALELARSCETPALAPKGLPAIRHVVLENRWESPEQGFDAVPVYNGPDETDTLEIKSLATAAAARGPARVAAPAHDSTPVPAAAHDSTPVADAARVAAVAATRQSPMRRQSLARTIIEESAAAGAQAHAATLASINSAAAHTAGTRIASASMTAARTAGTSTAPACNADTRIVGTSASPASIAPARTVRTSTAPTSIAAALTTASSDTRPHITATPTAAASTGATSTAATSAPTARSTARPVVATAKATTPPASAYTATTPRARTAITTAAARIPETDAFKRALARRNDAKQRREPTVSNDSLAQLSRLALTRRRVADALPVMLDIKRRRALFVGSGVFAAATAVVLTYFMVGGNHSMASSTMPLVASIDRPVPNKPLPWQQQPAAQTPTPTPAQSAPQVQQASYDLVPNEPVTMATDMELRSEPTTESPDSYYSSPPAQYSPPPGPSEPPAYDANGMTQQ
jgi:hypothetical protein